MMPQLDLQQFILDNLQSWESKLSADPFNLIIKREPGLVLFKYHQFLSDMSQSICREARGVILYEEDWTIAAIAFNKFFNYGEPLAAEIDWPSARIQEKVDGSLIKLWYNKVVDEWVWSTNGTIYAHNASLEFATEEIATFADLTWAAAEKSGLHDVIPQLGRDYTYVFEVVSPHNRIVVPYRDTTLYQIGTRSNLTAEETPPAIPGIPKPKAYQFSSLEETLAAARELDYTQEGFVVVDGRWNRVKIKGEDYLRVHRIRGDVAPTPRRILDLILSEQADDFLGLFPEYEEAVTNMLNRYLQFLKAVMVDVWLYREEWAGEQDRKRYALEFAKKCVHPPLMFKLRDGHVSPRYWMDYFRDQLSVDQLLKAINVYECEGEESE